MGSRTRQLRTVLCSLALCGAGVVSCGESPRAADRGAAGGSSTRGGSESSNPTRIVSLIPAATEILFALGAGDRVVGRTRWGVHPPEATAVTDVGDGVRPSLEAVLARDPDLVVLFDGADTEGVSDRLRALGVASLSIRHNTLSDLERNVIALGDVVGCAAAAQELNGRIRGDLLEVAGAVRNAVPLRVYYDVWSDPPITIGRGSFLDSLLTLAGGRNIFGDMERASPQVGLESIVQRDPDIVVYAVSGLSGDDGDPPQGRPGWNVVRAVAEGRIARVDADLLGRLGPRVGHAARELALALRPDAKIPSLETRPLTAECES